jgi:hypothetical protein
MACEPHIYNGLFRSSGRKRKKVQKGSGVDPTRLELVTSAVRRRLHDVAVIR